MIDANAVGSSDEAHFAAIPWCTRHLQGNRVIARTPSNRTLKSTNEDALFADTLNSEKGISRMLQVHEEPLSPSEPVNEVKVFLTLGRGLDGYPNVCHGGLVATILDEVVGMLTVINRGRRNMPSGTLLTAYLNTRFIKPVPTAATILARAWYTKVEGRKSFMQGTIEDENGDILARADVLYVELRSSL
ncbi:hypothetical protein NUW58_g1027 [Xylaria curta]|uniref:Uncharacterized protein n=1 Tax=Xylaria curta TaxID=42375 RepID=A0ACC1PMJ3_9PEZI|nr:hypothetical protein NUW58_g1027 [Xylaria curta]